MNKPILVKNQSEWERLAPVLEALGYVWANTRKIPTEFAIHYYPYYISLHGSKELTWRQQEKEPIQSVDEYLQAQEPKELNWNDAIHSLQKPKSSETISLEPDYKAKYETLLQGVKDIKAEITENYLLNANGDIYEKGYAFGLSKALEILTEKTKIQP
jgi:hypothetical protein